MKINKQNGLNRENQTRWYNFQKNLKYTSWTVRITTYTSKNTSYTSWTICHLDHQENRHENHDENHNKVSKNRKKNCKIFRGVKNLKQKKSIYNKKVKNALKKSRSIKGPDGIPDGPAGIGDGPACIHDGPAGI